MKKIVLRIAILSLSITSHCQNALKTVSEVSFGRYGFDCSSGRGACSFNVSKENTGITYGKNAKKVSENSFQLEIDKNSLTKQEQVRVFGMPLSEINPDETIFFVQEETLTLSIATLETLQIEARYSKIATGYYPMTITRDKVKIVFTLQEPDSKE
jgi:hypothetical protein